EAHLEQQVLGGRTAEGKVRAPSEKRLGSVAQPLHPDRPIRKPPVVVGWRRRNALPCGQKRVPCVREAVTEDEDLAQRACDGRREQQADDDDPRDGDDALPEALAPGNSPPVRQNTSVRCCMAHRYAPSDKACGSRVPGPPPSTRRNAVASQE